MNRKLIITTSCFVGALIGVGLLQYYLVKQKKQPETSGVKSKDIVPAKGTSAKPIIQAKEVKKQSDTKKEVKKQQILIKDFPLKLGSKGQYVSELQMYLLKNHGWADVAMGEFDTPTQQRVQRFLKVTEVDKFLYQKITGKVIL